MSELEVLKNICSQCTDCELCNTRKNVVFGEGKPNATIMLIGEAPGKTEDEGGEPFTGKSGKILNDMLKIATVKRSQVYIANVLKCRPPNNRDPLPNEIKTCSKYLRRQINLVNPLVIVTLGNFATKFVTGTDKGISEIHGTKFYTSKNRLVFPVYHPAATIYDNKKLKELEQDFNTIKYYCI